MKDELEMNLKWNSARLLYGKCKETLEMLRLCVKQDCKVIYSYNGVTGVQWYFQDTTEMKGFLSKAESIEGLSISYV